MEAMEASMKAWGLLWKLRLFHAVEASMKSSTEATSTEAFMKASTEDPTEATSTGASTKALPEASKEASTKASTETTPTEA